MTIGIVLTATDTQELNADLHRVFQGRSTVTTLVAGYAPKNDTEPSTASKILTRLLRNSAATRASKVFLKYEFDFSLSDTLSLIRRSKELTWDAVLLTHQSRLHQFPARIREMLDIFLIGDVDVVYDGDCPYWSEVVSVSTLDSYAKYMRSCKWPIRYPHRFFYFREATTIRTANIGLAHRNFSFNGSFILPDGGMTIGDQGDVTWRLKHIPDVRNQTVLDIGCEEGYAVFHSLTKGAATATGLNIDESEEYDLFPEHRRGEFPVPTTRTIERKENTIRWLKQIYGYSGDQARFRYQSIYRIGGETFEVVYCFGVMYHVKDPFLAIERLYSATRKILVIESQGVPDQQETYKEAALQWFIRGTRMSQTRRARRLLAEFDPKPFNFWLFSPALLQSLLLQVGFKEVTVERVPRFRKDSVVCRAIK